MKKHPLQKYEPQKPKTPPRHGELFVALLDAYLDLRMACWIRIDTGDIVAADKLSGRINAARAALINEIDRKVKEITDET
jgi:hypothetical protein